VLQLKLIENFISVCTTYSIEHKEGTVFYDCILAYATKCVFTPYVTQILAYVQRLSKLNSRL